MRFRDGSGITVKNNVMSKPIWNRGNAECKDLNNVSNADISGVLSQEQGDLLTAGLSAEFWDATDDTADESITETLTLDETISDLITHFEATEDAARLLLEVRLERQKTKEERLLATRERLTAREERLKTTQIKLLIDERLSQLEQTQKSIDHKLDEIQRLLQKVES